MTAFNVFRILGDLAHIVSKVILMWAIHWNRSAEGVSLITQFLYIVVFCTRYLDIFDTNPFDKFLYFYLFAVKAFYIASSAYIVFLMMFAYARTREREKAWKMGLYCLLGALVLAAPLCKIFAEGPVVREVNGQPIHLYVHKWSFKEVSSYQGLEQFY
jgi:ER lumen protein retaining receptor